jgi:hypothetical protein
MASPELRGRGTPCYRYEDEDVVADEAASVYHAAYALVEWSI